MNRFGVIRGVTPYELVHKKPYSGAVAPFAEPVFGYYMVGAKGTAKWRRALFLGKVDGQDSYILYSGHRLVLTRSIRRIDSDWKNHLAFYSTFRCSSWEYKSGFGGRVVPTKIKREALSVGFQLPQGEIEPSAFHDAEGEAVREKAREELREESERIGMGEHDERRELPAVEDDAPPEVNIGIGVEGMEQEDGFLTLGDEVEKDADRGGAATSSRGNDVPATPILVDDDGSGQSFVPATPRASPTTRMHGDGEDDVDIEEHQNKRLKPEDPKRARIQRIAAEYSAKINSVQFGGDKFHTMDSYDDDLDVEKPDETLELWAGEDDLQFNDVPEDLWSNFNMEQQPEEPPEWVDVLANELEISRLTSMGVLIKEELYAEKVTDSLTTKFVHDWGAKDFTLQSGEVVKRWLRRSRLVAREYAFLERRDDCFSPATSCYVTNLLPLVYLQKCNQRRGCENQSPEHVLGVVDIKDAFLCVPQERPFAVQLAGRKFIIIIAKKLPGQRLGAKAWYWLFRTFLTETFGFEWCNDQPCMGRCEQAAIMVHVDDVMFTGTKQFWENHFLPKLREKFTVSSAVLGENEGDSVSFLKRKLTRVKDGIALVPGTNIAKLVENFEKQCGTLRVQRVACDSSIQLPDVSSSLRAQDAFAYRSTVGGLLYLARDRPDLLFCVKELASKMSNPSITALHRLRKVMGYVKGTIDYAVVLQEPEGGQGKWVNTGEAFYVLESSSDSDWSSNKEHRRSTSAGIHMINGNYVFGSSRTQRTVSLSSCEAELHAMVSTLADGIYIKRCLSFLTRAEVAHHLLTDSSSARQLAAKQGVGKVRHLDGKILWIQQHVLSGDVQLQQLPTVWNVSDLCTKALTQQRVKLLLHELNVCDDAGLTVIGQEEHDQQSERHGSKRQMMKLAKNLIRIFSLMGLGPSGAAGQGIFPDGEDTGTCSVASMSPQCAENETTKDFPWMLCFCIFLLVISWVIFAAACHVLVHMCSYFGPGNFSIWSVAILLQVSPDLFIFAPS